MAREVELKLDIDPACVPRLAELPFLSEPPARQRQVSVYFDTPKARLHRTGWAFRIRRIGDRYVQTIKRSVEAAGMFDRDEWECDVPGPEPDWRHVADTPLATLLSERQLRGLVPVVQSDVMRSTWKVADKGATIEICLDEARIEAGDSVEETVELELELIEGDAQALLAKAKKICAHIPVKLGVLAKSERGFALANATRDIPVKATHVALLDDISVAEGFTAIINACLKHFRLNEPMLIERRDSEALHQLRVAIRRIRSALWLFRPAV
ncbi:MAG TPA: inorganic triphosphatase, partial [Sphingomicrobium sp.]|nr:inorganic triphosphatase [Sphingomicrobium sp.]